jgi:hypothetical protein
MTPSFTVEERAGLVSTLADLLRTDARVEGVILVGSLVQGGDRWSDIDLQVAVAAGADAGAVAHSWRERSYAELPVLHHITFGLGDGQQMLCLLLDSLLEIDLTFTATADLGVYEPFRLLYDRTGASSAALVSPPAWSSEPPDWVGTAGGFWHDVLHACTAVHRDRRWQALFYLERIRTATLRLASQQRGYYGGELNYVDDLPAELLSILRPTLVSSLEPKVLFAAIEAATRCFLLELWRAEPTLADRLGPPLLVYVTTLTHGDH